MTLSALADIDFMFRFTPSNIASIPTAQDRNTGGIIISRRRDVSFVMGDQGRRSRWRRSMSRMRRVQRAGSESCSGSCSHRLPRRKNGAPGITFKTTTAFHLPFCIERPPARFARGDKARLPLESQIVVDSPMRAHADLRLVRDRPLPVLPVFEGNLISFARKEAPGSRQSSIDTFGSGRNSLARMLSQMCSFALPFVPSL